MPVKDWLAFFRDAGIPTAAAKMYADSFVRNDITGDMLGDLNKGYLNDMGIKGVGDIIRILR